MHQVKICLLYCLLLTTSLLQAASHPDGSALFFVSNNTGIIGMREPYQRLKGPEQEALKDKIIEVTVSHGMAVDAAHFEALLGRYQMSDTQAITADNVEVFETAVGVRFTDDQLFSLASQLANALHQDSVAVFIFHHEQPNGRFVLLLHRHPTIDVITEQIAQKLPADYNAAYSLHLEPGHRLYGHARVVSVEWLGAATRAKTLSDPFRREKIMSEQGVAYLVYRDGTSQAL